MKPSSSLRSLYGLALRNLWTRKTRTLLTALGIVLGVAVILAINIANSSTLASINKIFDEASGLADLVIVPSSLTGQGFSEATLGRVKSIEGVQAAVPSVSATTLLAQDAKGWSFNFGLGGATGGNSLLLFGIDPETDQRARQYNLIAGRFLEQAAQFSAVFTRDYADKEHHTGQRCGHPAAVRHGHTARGGHREKRWAGLAEQRRGGVCADRRGA
jgi:ABC-type antimicrobial peptide transport system permease subunit